MTKGTLAVCALLFVAACDTPNSTAARHNELVCGTTLNQTGSIELSTAQGQGDQFGASVAASGRWLAVAAPGGSTTWMFDCPLAGNCEARQGLIPSELGPGEFSATHVAMSDNVLAVSRSGDDGLVDVFTLGADELWTYDTTLISEPSVGQVTALAVWPDFIAVGRSDGQGVVELYNREATEWQFVVALADETYDGIGASLTFAGTNLYVGADRGAAVLSFNSAADWEQFVFTDPATPAADAVGASVAVDQARVYVGAPLSDQGATDAGRVIVFNRSDGAFLGYLDPDSPEDGARFGATLASNGLAALAVGSPGSDADAGAVSIFDFASGDPVFISRPNLVWKSGTTGIGDALVFRSEDLVAGIAGDSFDGTDVGGVFTLQQDEDGSGSVDWSTVGRLSNPRGLGAAHIGLGGISATQDRVLVGSPKYSAGGHLSGAAFTFVRDGDEWAEEAALVPPEAISNSQAGEAIVLLDQVALVGMPGHIDVNPGVGVVRVFTFNGNWSATATIRNPDPQEGERFGGALASDGARVVVGERWGRQAHVFTVGSWALEATIDDTGNAVDIHGDLLLGGLEFAEEGLGSVRLFEEVAPGDWQVLADLVPPERVERYGAAVVLGDEVAFAYAPATTAAEVEFNYGVVHVFAPDADGTWQFVRSLTSDAPSEKAWFGRTLAVNGDLLAVGAQGDTRDAESVGAVYLYGRDVGGANAWGLIRRITQVPPTNWSSFGTAVGWTGGDLLIADPFGSSAVAGGAGRIETLSNAANQPPIANDDEVLVPRNADEVAIAVVDNDADADADDLFVILDGTPARGVAEVVAEGVIVYRPGPDFGGSDSFTYVVSDCQSTSAPATVTLIGEAATCDAATACPEGQTCVGESCFTECAKNDECGNGEACFGGHCAVEACDGVICAESEICYGGGCFAACVDGACESGLCFDGRCASDSCAGVTCAEGDVCAGGSCFASCAADTECLPDLSCFDGRCATEACDQFQCATGESCIGGSCFVGAECAVAADCRPGQLCEDGLCVSPERDGCCRTVPKGTGNTPLLLIVALLATIRRR